MIRRRGGGALTMEESLITSDRNNNSHRDRHYNTTGMSESTDESLLLLREKEEDNEGEDNDNNVNVVLTVEEALDRLGMGLYQYGIGLTAGLCITCDAIEILLLSFLSIVLRAEWGLTSAEAASVFSSSFLGSLLGTLALGSLGDRYGRRPVFLVSAGMIAVFGVASALATSLLHLLLLRFGLGFGIGGSTLGFDSLAETLPSSHRGKHLTNLNFFWALGTVMTPLLAYWTLGEQPSSNNNHSSSASTSWRTFVGVCAIPCWIAWILGFCLIPESPRWLTANGRTEEALRVLRRAAKTNGHNPDTMFPPNATKLISTTTRTEIAKERKTSKQMVELFQPNRIRTTLKLMGAGFGEGFLYFGTLLAVTLVFSTQTKSGYSFDYGAIFTSCSAEIVGLTIVLIGVDRWGRIRTQTTAWVVGGICTSLMCLLHQYSYRESMEQSSVWLLVSLVVLSFGARALVLTGAATLWISVTEILPTQIRSSGHSLTYASGRIGGFVCPYIINNSTPLARIAAVVATVAILNTCCVAQLPETLGKAMGSDQPQQQENERDETKCFSGPIV